SVLQKLSDQIDETVGIAIMQDLEVVYVDRVLSNWPLQIYLPAGTHVPIWASASGKLLLAQLPDNECHRIINRMTIHALTKSTLVDKHILLDKIDSIRHSQVGTDNEEFIPGMVACAVPIPNGDNPVFATVFTHGPTIRKSLDELLSYVPQMQEAALALQQIFQRQSM
ncbi:IclR family transcriptional regulator, partial [Escherichia coli]